MLWFNFWANSFFYTTQVNWAISRFWNAYVVPNSTYHGELAKSTSIGGSCVEFTRFSRKKYIIICYSNDSVSPRSFRMNPSRHCSAGPTPRGSPLLVNLFFFLKKNQKKNNNKNFKLWTPAGGSLMLVLLNQGDSVLDKVYVCFFIFCFSVGSWKPSNICFSHLCLVS